jgi:transcriptional regulator with PAS, ATPase and Fis domain
MVEAGEFRADLYYRLAVIPLNIPPLKERQGDIPLLVKNFIHSFSERGYGLATVTLGAMRMLLDYPWPGNVRELINAVEHGIICAEQGVISEHSLPYDVRHHFYEDGESGVAQKYVESTPEDGEMQRRAEVVAALHLAKGNRSTAARILGVDRSTLWRKMQRYDIVEEENK